MGDPFVQARGRSRTERHIYLHFYKQGGRYKFAAKAGKTGVFERGVIKCAKQSQAGTGDSAKSPLSLVRLMIEKWHTRWQGLAVSTIARSVLQGRCYKVGATRSMLQGQCYKVGATRSVLQDRCYKIGATRSVLQDRYYKVGATPIRLRGELF